MILDFIFAGIAFYLMVPFVAGYFAHSYGRSFWLWFGLACVLPILSHFLLLLLVYMDERGRSPYHLTKKEEADMDKLIKKVIREIENKGRITKNQTKP